MRKKIEFSNWSSCLVETHPHYQPKIAQVQEIMLRTRKSTIKRPVLEQNSLLFIYSKISPYSTMSCTCYLVFKAGEKGCLDLCGSPSQQKLDWKTDVLRNRSIGKNLPIFPKGGGTSVHRLPWKECCTSSPTPPHLRDVWIIQALVYSGLFITLPCCSLGCKFEECTRASNFSGSKQTEALYIYL